MAFDSITGRRWIQADVFSAAPLSGNGLAVFPEAGGLSTETMQRLTQELRQFESIFLEGCPEQGPVTARIFTMEEELNFAGHPVLGAASILHHLADSQGEMCWRLALNAGEARVTTRRRCGGYWAEMDQGRAAFGKIAAPELAKLILDGLGLGPSMVVTELPIAMVSTGLPYVIVPVTAEGLSKSRIQCTDFEQRLAGLGGKFAYVFDPGTHEGRSWDNLGLVEDVATGSAAGPAAAYLWRHCEAPESLTVYQGRFTGRPSEIVVRRDPSSGSVLVSGDVVVLAEGRFI